MYASIAAATVHGPQGRPVTVEVHVSDGLPGFTIVGQPDGPCREARDRVRAALLSSGLSWPLRRITVNLAPASLRKFGSALDLAMAVGVLVATGEIPIDRVEGRGFLAELGLDGSLRRFAGTLAHLDAVEASEVVVAEACLPAARLLGRHTYRTAANLLEVVEALRGNLPWPDPPVEDVQETVQPAPDLRDVRGQVLGRFAAEVAAAGGHHLLFIGPPGAGKTMLAERLPGLLPTLTAEQSLDVLRIQSAAGLDPTAATLPKTPPLRMPHHSASAVALLGGGSGWMRPGEISCAHHGVLFLDELGEFPATVLDALRQPLERSTITVDRAAASITYPARFLLIAATNPCPCGWRGSGIGLSGTPVCRCSTAARDRYARRLSGPFLDRFDLRVELERPDPELLLGDVPMESTAVVRERVLSARAVAEERQGCTNGSLLTVDLDRFAALTSEGRRLLDLQLRRGELTARGVARIRRVARTIADLSGASDSYVLSDTALATAMELRRRPGFEERAA